MNLLKSKKASLQELSLLYKKASYSHSAGLSIQETLKSLKVSPALIKQGLNKGQKLSQLMRVSGRFPKFDLILIKTAEKSGGLDQVFNHLSEYYKEKAFRNEKILKGLYYPLSMFVLAILLRFTVFLFSSPMTTLDFLSLLLIPLLSLLALFFATKRLLSGQIDLHREVIKLFPSFFELSQKLRFYFQLSLSYQSGISIAECLKEQVALTHHPELKAGIKRALLLIKKGKGLSDALRESGIFSEVDIDDIYQGEVSGALEDSFKRIVKRNEQSAREKNEVIGKWGPKIIYFLCLAYFSYSIISSYIGRI